MGERTADLELLNVGLQFNGTISASCNFRLEGSKTGFHHVGQTGLELLTSGSGSVAQARELECSDVIMAHCSLHFLNANSCFISASQVAGTTGTHQLSFVIFVEMGFCHVPQACLELLGSSDPPALASQSVYLF
ncbi:Zinc finger protein [Plecturocebus cupreus]